MVKLDRYIGVTVFVAILAVLGVILGLALLFAFIDELNDISASYGIGDALRFIFLTAPRRAYDMLPMAALIGCLVGLGTLASNSELTIMRAAGVSLSRIVWAVMKPMLVLMLAGILVGEYVAPWTENIAQSGRALAQGGGDSQSSKRGLWHRQGREYIHINAVQPNGVLYGVTRYRFDEQRGLESASFAKRARFETDHWQLEEVTTTLLHPREKRSEVIVTDRTLGCPAQPATAEHCGDGARGAVYQRSLAVHPLSRRPGPEQQPLLAGVLDQGPATAGDRRAGADGDFLHLRSVALGDPGPADLHRRAGGLRLPHRPGPARTLQPGVRLPAAAGGGDPRLDLRTGGCLAATPGGLTGPAGRV